MPVIFGRSPRRGGWDFNRTLTAPAGNAAGATTVTVVPGLAPAVAGERLPVFVIVTWVTTASLETITGVADTQSNAYTVWQNAATVGAGVAICGTNNQGTAPLTTTDTITVTFSASVANRGISLHEWNHNGNNMAPSLGPISGTVANGTTVTTTLNGSTAPNDAHIWLQACAWVGNAAGTPATNYTERADALAGTLQHYFQSRVASTGGGQGAIGPTWTGNRLAVAVGLGIPQGDIPRGRGFDGCAVLRSSVW